MDQVKPTASLREFQKFIERVYALPDDRLYSLWDLLAQEQRFAMRALKGIRKEDSDKLKQNLLIAFSWVMAIANRLHIDTEGEVWKRFPNLCSYCGKRPCACRKIKAEERLNVKGADANKTANRTLADAGVHLAEEVGEVNEAVHAFLGQHQAEQFNEVQLEIADLISCAFTLANSANIDIAQELSKMYANNCHVCHAAPCSCTFSDITQLRT
jgi:NTP pyrophosphatase (non-canonical NTP hydrolase)